MSVSGLTVEQIKKMDRMAISHFGVPSLVLMENAGSHVALEVARILRKKRNVLIACGSGNNAGDGLVAARHLINKGLKVTVWLTGRADKLLNDAKVNYLIMKKTGCPIIDRAGAREIKKFDIVVDAIFGVGLNRDIETPLRGCIEAINRNAKRILAVDIPSGLDGTTGKVYGACIKADATVTFSFPKMGFGKNDGPRMTGKLIVVDIGIPKILKDRILR